MNVRHRHPKGMLMSPKELEQWIDDDDNRSEQAWEDHENGAAKKWLVAAIEPDQSILFATDELQSKTYPLRKRIGARVLPRI